MKAKSAGLLGALQGAEKKALPRQARLDELVAEARAILAKMPGSTLLVVANALLLLRHPLKA